MLEALLVFVVLFGSGFAAGYGVRALASRRRSMPLGVCREAASLAAQSYRGAPQRPLRPHAGSLERSARDRA